MSKPNIVFTRIDNRLIHGQVGNVWATNSGANLILVADDEVCNDPLQQSLMKMTADAAGMQVRFFSIQKTIDIIGRASQAQKIFIVAKTPFAIEKLVNGGVPIDVCNIGNMHQASGKKVFHDVHVYVDEEDIACFERLKQLGVKMYIQITPNSIRSDL